jgi:hypothetical protein
MSVPSPGTKHSRSSVMGALAWCCGQLGKLLPLKRERLRESKISRTQGNCGPSDADILDMPRYCYDASLLFRRMTLLQIDRDELARDEPLLLRELQGLCTLCGSKGECVRDLARECKTGEPQDWQEYCPNAATLNAFAALQNCPRAAQYLKAPPASKLVT